MWGTKCNFGINALRMQGVNASVDTSLAVYFQDPLGLYTDICKLQHRYAIQGTFPFKAKSSQCPTLFIDGKNMGNIKNLKVDEIRALAKPSSFGKGSKTVYDENVRKALEITGDRINFNLKIPEEIQKLAPFNHQIEVRLYKLAIYEKDGFFSEHADTLHGDDHLGTLLICLPVEHEGGAFVLSDDGNELRLPFDELIKADQVPWVAFYSDVKHKVEVVKKGTRMTLQYDLYATNYEDPEGNFTFVQQVKGHQYIKDPKASYHFVDYNQEILDSIWVKLNNIFENKKPSKKRKREDKETGEEEEGKLEPETTKQIKEKKGKKKSQPKVQSVFVDLNQNREEKKEILIKEPDGIAIMLKRRYGAKTLSETKLKGSDNALYLALKDHFTVEVKPIILEISTTYEGDFTGQPIDVVALNQVTGISEEASSDEEVKIDPNVKHVPQKIEKKEVENVKNKGKSKIENWTNEGENTNVKQVCLVSGYSGESLSAIVQQQYVEYTGNEAMLGVYSYLHGALFVYPKQE